MSGRGAHRTGTRLTTAAAAALILLVIFGGLSVFGLSTTSSSVEAFGDGAVSRASYGSLMLGSTLGDVEDRIGPGKDALEFRESGVALEPIDADCRYYPQAGTGNYRDIIQLCYRDDRLVRKQAYEATPGSPLG